MTQKNQTTTSTPSTPSSNASTNTSSATTHTRPWASAGAGVDYAGDVADIDDAVPSFMSALRRFRARHGLSPIHQGQHLPLLDDEDLLNLRDGGCERPGLDLDQLADPAQR
jgi:hypothetical protein